MSLEVLDSSNEIAARLRAAVEGALPGARVEANPTAPGHFELTVLSEAFRGRSLVEQHQLVYAAVAPLMRGANAPVHAIDRLRTQAP